MLDKLAGIPTQIRALERRLKDMDASKVSPAKIKEVTDTLKNLKELLKEKQDKREQRKKDKASKTEEVAVEASTDVEALSKCPVCAKTFPSAVEYQTHHQLAHEPKKQYVPMDPEKKKEIVKNVENNPKFAPHIISEQEKPVASLEKFSVDDKVQPIRGSNSWGHVMRPADVNGDPLVYVKWMEGPLADSHGFGGYYPSDLKKKSEGNPTPPDISITSEVDVMADLKSKYDDLLKDLKDEHREALDKHDHTWVARLDQKIKELEQKIQEKFGNEKISAQFDHHGSDLYILPNSPEEAAKIIKFLNRDKTNFRWSYSNVEGQPWFGKRFIEIPFGEYLEPAMRNYFKNTPLKTKNIEEIISKKEADSLFHCEHCHSEMSPLEQSHLENLPNGDQKWSCDKTAGHENGSGGTERLVVMDHTPPRANSGPDAGGKDGNDEYQDMWANPDGRDLNASQLTYPFAMSMTKEQLMDLPTISQGHFSNLKFDDGKHRIWVSRMTKKDGASEDNAVEFETLQNGRWIQASINKKAIVVNVFKRDWEVVPVWANQKDFKGYDIISDSGKKIMHIAPKTGKQLNKEQLEYVIGTELTKGLKQAKLTEKVSFLKKGSKVFVMASDSKNKRAKIVSFEHNVRAWVPESKIKIAGLEGQSVDHNGHSDKVLGASKSETLLDCVEMGPTWVNSVELLDANRPAATPESLNDLESAKECADCHGQFEGAEDEKCPTCGRFAVTKKADVPQSTTDNRFNPQTGGWKIPCEQKGNGPCSESGETMKVDNHFLCPKHHMIGTNASENKEALKQALPPLLPNQRMDANASLNKSAHIRHEDGKWVVYNHDYTKRLGEYPTREKALHRLKQIEYFKNASVRPFSKKAEVLTDPYAALTTHITDMKSRMEQVQERMQAMPNTKVAGEEDNSEMDLPALFEDLSMGINLLETKLGGDDKSEPKIHNMIEELENKLWKLEEECGITPMLDAHEKSEPEHKEVVEKVKEMEKEADSSTTTTTTTSPVSPTVNTNTTSPTSPTTNTNTTPDDQKSACSLCGGLTFPDYPSYQQHMEFTHASDIMPTTPGQKENKTVANKKTADTTTVTEETNDPNAVLVTPTTTVPSPNIQPTDNDNLDIPVAMPTSPTPPGTKWVFDADNNVYVVMPDGSNPNKTI